MNKIFMFTFCLVLAACSATHASTIVTPAEDVMTSAFFQGTNLVRGYAGDARPTFRVSSNNAFGAGPETVYLDFNPADFSSLIAPVENAILTMESVDGGFGANASLANPFEVSVHAVSANPLANITDDTNPTGSIAWDDFFVNNIELADSAAMTTITSFGSVEFDISAIVNDWLDGSNTIFALAVTAKNDTLSDGNVLHGFANNTEVPGSTFLTITSIPEPSSILLVFPASVLLVGWLVRTPRSTH